MILIMGLIVCLAGLYAIIFNKRLALSTLRHHPTSKQKKMLLINRIAYILTGGAMAVVSCWTVLRNMN